MADPRIRNIKIKTGVVKRLAKEKTSYEKEVEDQEKKIEKMKTDGKDEYDIKKQLQVLEESRVMIGDSQKRFKNEHESLKNLLENEKDLCEAEEYKAAQTMLEETKSVLA